MHINCTVIAKLAMHKGLENIYMDIYLKLKNK